MGRVEDMAARILEKKELSGMDAEFVEARIMEYASRNARFMRMLSSPESKIQKNSEYKRAFTHIRKELHGTYGAFIGKGYEKRREMLVGLRRHLAGSGKVDAEAVRMHGQMMETHLSTKERLGAYPRLYEGIFGITGQPKRILDISAGLNPLSHIWMGKGLEYYATELGRSDVGFLQAYFETMRPYTKINGKAFRLDLLRLREIGYGEKMLRDNPGMGKTDVAFVFKTLPTVEKAAKNISDSIREWVPSKWAVVSFSAKSMSGGKRISDPRRAWFERKLDGAGHPFEALDFGNEVFYVFRNFQ